MSCFRPGLSVNLTLSATSTAINIPTMDGSQMTKYVRLVTLPGTYAYAKLGLSGVSVTTANGFLITDEPCIVFSYGNRQIALVQGDSPTTVNITSVDTK